MCEVIISSSEQQTPESQAESSGPIWTWALDRLSEVLTRPNPEFWEGLGNEKRSNATVVFAYLIPLLLGAWGFGLGAQSFFVVWGLWPTVLIVAWSLTAVIGLSFLLGLVANHLAPRSGGINQKSSAFRFFAYLHTPLLLAVTLLYLCSLAQLATLGNYLVIAGFLYGIYLLWIGLPAFFKLGSSGNIIRFPLTISVIWFALQIVLLNATTALANKLFPVQSLNTNERLARSLGSPGLAGVTIQEGFHVDFRALDLKPQHTSTVHKLWLFDEVRYRFLLRASRELKRDHQGNVDLMVTDSDGAPLRLSDPLDKNGATFLEITPEKSGVYYVLSEIGDLGGASERASVELFQFSKPVLADEPISP